MNIDLHTIIALLPWAIIGIPAILIDMWTSGDALDKRMRNGGQA